MYNVNRGTPSPTQGLALGRHDKHVGRGVRRRQLLALQQPREDDVHSFEQGFQRAPRRPISDQSQPHTWQPLQDALGTEREQRKNTVRA